MSVIQETHQNMLREGIKFGEMRHNSALLDIDSQEYVYWNGYISALMELEQALIERDRSDVSIPLNQRFEEQAS